MKFTPSEIESAFTGGEDDNPGCLVKYVRQYALRDMPRTKNNKWGVLGTVVHATFEQLYKFELFKNVKYLLNLLHKNFDTEFSKTSTEALTEKDIGFLRKYAVSNVTSGYETLKRERLLIPPVSTEESFRLHLLPQDGATQTGNYIDGKIDKIFERNDEYLVIDYKTGNYMPNRKELKKHIQLTAYSFAVYKLYNRLCKSALVFTRHKKILYTDRQEKDYSDLIKKVEMLTPYKSLTSIDGLQINPSQKACMWCELNANNSCDGPKKIGLK